MQVNTINATSFNQSPGGEEYQLICKRIELLKLEHEESESVRKHELEIIRLKCELARCPAGSHQVSSPNVLSQDKFNIGGALKVVPISEESNIPEFFKAFERVATRLVWPREFWTVIIQCRLVGKALRVYHALEEGIALDYNKVKSLVLKAYDLVPEAYLLKFRTVNKPPSMTLVEYARLKEEQFDDWVKIRQVGTFSSLKELMCLEVFKKVCGRELKLHLEEVKADNLATATQIADEFVLTHKAGSSSFSFNNSSSPHFRPPKVTSPGRSWSKDNNPVNKTFNQTLSSPFNKQVTPGKTGTFHGNCFWCKKPGHHQAQCFARKNYLSQTPTNPASRSPVLAVARVDDVGSHTNQENINNPSDHGIFSPVDKTKPPL
ncbi:uncharacterized protein [Palaemon carinicauda]|uniref:uncharacterized protein n=1 Tax=Palaemon carinicauda TaxID=392227 RepID=UPI0035B5B218